MIDPAIPRLYAYHRALREAAAAGETTITSQGLAGLLGHSISSTQIRKDLSSLGPLRRRGQRYAINPLVEQPALVLGLEHESRFGIAAIFDRSPEMNASMEHDIQRDCNAADGEAQA